MRRGICEVLARRRGVVWISEGSLFVDSSAMSSTLEAIFRGYW